MTITRRREVCPTQVASPRHVSPGNGTGRARDALLLSVLALVFAFTASVAGLIVDGLYGDPASVASMLRGYDLVTLVVAVPTLGATLLAAAALLAGLRHSRPATERQPPHAARDEERLGPAMIDDSDG